MENKIPLPTDNIYKFYAMFGLLLLVFVFGATIYVNRTSNDQLIGKIVELETLKQDMVPSSKTKLQIAIAERQTEILKFDKEFYLLSLGLIGGIGVCLIVYGFRKWHKEVQPLNDMAAKVQLEISQLQLNKLRAEAKMIDVSQETPHK